MNVKQIQELQTTTRQITGKNFVPAAKLRNIKGDVAEVHIDGRIYEAVLANKTFVLTGDYTTA